MILPHLDTDKTDATSSKFYNAPLKISLSKAKPAGCRTANDMLT
jgi:hypothetical protein